MHSYWTPVATKHGTQSKSLDSAEGDDDGEDDGDGFFFFLLTIVGLGLAAFFGFFFSALGFWQQSSPAALSTSGGRREGCSVDRLLSPSD